MGMFSSVSRSGLRIQTLGIQIEAPRGTIVVGNWRRSLVRSRGYHEVKENEEENEVIVKRRKERGRKAGKEHENGTMKRRCRKEGRTG